MTDEPFMEHPNGDVATAVDAITDAITRLAQLDPCDSWLTFSGQGQGSRPDSYHVVDLPVRGRSVDVGDRAVDLDGVLSHAGLDGAALEVSLRDTIIELPEATAGQFAAFLDSLFQHLGVRPFDDEDDYAVGAEW